MLSEPSGATALPAPRHRAGSGRMSTLAFALWLSAAEPSLPCREYLEAIEEGGECERRFGERSRGPLRAGLALRGIATGLAARRGRGPLLGGGHRRQPDRLPRWAREGAPRARHRDERAAGPGHRSLPGPCLRGPRHHLSGAGGPRLVRARDGERPLRRPAQRGAGGRRAAAEPRPPPPSRRSLPPVPARRDPRTAEAAARGDGP